MWRREEGGSGSRDDLGGLNVLRSMDDVHDEDTATCITTARAGNALARWVVMLYDTLLLALTRSRASLFIVRLHEIPEKLCETNDSIHSIDHFARLKALIPS